MNDTFEYEFRDAISRLSIIDQLEEPAGLARGGSAFAEELPPPLCDIYHACCNPWHNVPKTVSFPPPMENVAWALVHWLGARDPEVAPELVERVRMLHYLAPLNFGRSFNDIWISARDGDEESLFALVQMDKSALYADEIRDIVVRKQYEGDWEFFEKLGKAIARPPLTGAARWHKAVLVVAYFWDDHFSRPEWPVQKIFRLLKDEGVLARQDKLTAFRFRLNRAGLKKPLHNRKQGN